MSSQQDRTDEQKATPRSKIKSRRELESGGAASTRKPTPTTLLIYVLIVIASFVYGLVIPGEPALAFDERLAVTIFFRLMIIFLLVNRSTIGWILGLAFEGIYIITLSLQIATQDPADSIKLSGLLFITIAGLALLLTRQTRQHIFAPKDAPDSPSAGQSAASKGDQERESSSSSSS